MTPKEAATRDQSKARMHEKNPAELIQMIEQNKGARMKHLNADAYNRVRPVLSVDTTKPPVMTEYRGFRVGDKVSMTKEGVINASLAGDHTEGLKDGSPHSRLPIHPRCRKRIAES